MDFMRPHFFMYEPDAYSVVGSKTIKDVYKGN